MRNKVNDHAEDGTFDDSDIERSADAAYAQDHGSLAENVAAESHAWFLWFTNTLT